MCAWSKDAVESEGTGRCAGSGGSSNMSFGPGSHFPGSGKVICQKDSDRAHVYVRVEYDNMCVSGHGSFMYVCKDAHMYSDVHQRESDHVKYGFTGLNLVQALLGAATWAPAGAGTWAPVHVCIRDPP